MSSRLRHGPAGKWAAAALGVALTLAGCSSPNPVLYTIAPVNGTPQGRGPRVIVVQGIATARYLERSEIVRSSENYQLEIMSNDWWGEPLSAMLGRVLIDELGQRLPQSTVLSDTGAVTASPDATIAVNIQRLDQDSTGNVILQSQVSLTIKGRVTPMLRSFRFAVPMPTKDVKGEVAGISAVVGQLADGVSAMLAGQ